LKIVSSHPARIGQEALKKPNDGIWSKPVCDEDLMKFETHAFFESNTRIQLISNAMSADLWLKNIPFSS
jgi:hypothetical protein